MTNGCSIREKTSLLIVEDEVITAMALKAELTNLGYKVLPSAGSYANALSIYQENMPDVILCDIRLGEDKDGIDLALKIRQDNPIKIKIIFITGYDNQGTKERAAQVNPTAYLVKPVNGKQIAHIIDSAIQSA